MSVLPGIALMAILARVRLFVRVTTFVPDAMLAALENLRTVSASMLSTFTSRALDPGAGIRGRRRRAGFRVGVG